MEKCSQCGRTEEQVKLFDGFSVTDTIKICEKCSLVNNIPIIKRPSVLQLKDSERPYGVRPRLMRMAHLGDEARKEKSAYEELREIEGNPELEQPEELVFKLVDNFHWIIQTERRRKGFTTKQLADAIHESENAIKLLEKAIVPSKSLDLIRGIEQILNIRLIKRDMIEQIEEQKKRNMLAEEMMAKRQAPRVITEDPERGITIENPGKIAPKDRPISLKSQEANQFNIRDLQMLNEKIDKDFEFEHKSREEVGKEQMEDIGKEDTEQIKRNIFRENRPKNSTPTIYDLMKKKEEKDKTTLVGSDIQIVEDKAKWDELE